MEKIMLKRNFVKLGLLALALPLAASLPAQAASVVKVSLWDKGGMMDMSKSMGLGMGMHGKMMMAIMGNNANERHSARLTIAPNFQPIFLASGFPSSTKLGVAIHVLKKSEPRENSISASRMKYSRPANGTASSMSGGSGVMDGWIDGEMDFPQQSITLKIQ